MPSAPNVGMTTETNRAGAHQFVALDIALQIVVALRDAIGLVGQHDVELAKQIVRSASSIAANVGEGRRRVGRDRLHFFASRPEAPKKRESTYVLLLPGAG